MDGAFHFVSLAIAAIGGIFSLIATIFWFGKRFAAVEFKVDTLWDFIMRRGLVAALNKGLVTMNSPITVPASSLQIYAGMIEDLQRWYVNVGKEIERKSASEQDKERNMFAAVEHYFGDRIVKEICIPHRMDVGECVVTALAICRMKDAKPESEKSSGDETHHDAE